MVRHVSIADVDGQEGLRIVSYWMVKGVNLEAAKKAFREHDSLPQPEVSLVPFRSEEVSVQAFFLGHLKQTHPENIPISFNWPFSERRAWTLCEGAESIFNFPFSGFRIQPEEISSAFFPDGPSIYLYEINSPKMNSVFSELHINRYIDKGYDLLSKRKREGYHFLWREPETLSPGRIDSEGFNITTYLTLV